VGKSFALEMTIMLELNMSCFSWTRGIPSQNSIVIFSGAHRSGEICGFVSVYTSFNVGGAAQVLAGCLKR
jgi:hypothetical protein